MLRANIRVYRGDDSYFKFTPVINCKVVNATGSTLTMTIQPDDIDEAPIQITNDHIQVFDNGIFVHIPHDITASCEWFRGRYDLQMKKANGEIKTLARGRVKLIHDITR